MTTTQESLTIFQRRYKEGYTIARLTGLIGILVQLGAVVLAVALIGGGIYGASQMSQSPGTPPQMSIGVAIAGALLGVIFGGLFFLLGILISAQGQLILATLDTAVNSTPSLSDEEKHLVTTRRAKAIH